MKKIKEVKTDADLSAPRKQPDLSPPRKDLNPFTNTVAHSSPPHNQIASPEPQLKVRRMAYFGSSSPSQDIHSKSSPRSALVKGSLKAGLITARDIKQQNSRAKEEEWLSYKSLCPSLGGRGAKPVFRNKITGNQISRDEFFKAWEKNKDESPKETKLEWGKGLAQKREAEEKMIQLELEKDRPFARTKDDPELDKMLKERIRCGDPMANLIKKKPFHDLVLPDLGNSDRMKESGFIIPQEIPDYSWIRRGVCAPPNRYGIKPGRHWDGIDRSTGVFTSSRKGKT